MVVFIGLTSEADQESWKTFSKWGYLSADQIRGGKVWGLVTSVYVHQEAWHLPANMYWLVVLGAPLERAIGSGRWLALFITAGLVSSAAELTITDDTGIGASGVIYAMFGFLWVTRKRYEGLERVLSFQRIFWFVVWVLACLAMTLADIWSVGNVAHISGLLLGLGCGAWILFVERRRLIGAGLAALVFLSLIGLVWAPWSMDWTSTMALRAHDRGDYKSALRWCERTLQLGTDKAWCWENIALACHSMGDKTGYRDALERLRRIDEKAATELESKVAEHPVGSM